MSCTIPFSQLNKTSIRAAGGKGANLGELTTGGLPVPAGFVLTTGAYEAFVQAHGLSQQIVELVHTVSADEPQSSKAASEKIRALFMQGVIADDVASEITAAYGQLTGAKHHAVAVRSSATAEDLPTASFAGQQDTYLNIHGEEALLDAVKKCWASLWTARAISYRMRQKIDPATVSLAVVVQQFVAADAAGVLFTANPVDGQRDQILINATWGLGEAIVSGQVTPDTVVVDKATWEILSRETATKATMTVRTDTGTEEREVPQARRDQQVLDDATTAQLARYGEQIEAHYGVPMDIEWAIADGEIAILQARPITSLPDPKPAPLKDVVWEPVAPNTIWMRRQIVEHMPAPLSPLFEDLYLNQGMDQSVDKMMNAMGEIVGGRNIDLHALLPHGFGIVKLSRIGLADPQHPGSRLGSSPSSWGPVGRVFVNLTVPARVSPGAADPASEAGRLHGDHRSDPPRGSVPSEEATAHGQAYRRALTRGVRLHGRRHDRESLRARAAAGRAGDVCAAGASAGRRPSRLWRGIGSH